MGCSHLCSSTFILKRHWHHPEAQKIVNRGALLAFADDMLILTNSLAEMKQAIQELDNLNGVWNLRLNKAKS